MNRIITETLGGANIKTNDLETIQLNVKTLTSAIANGLSSASDPFILYGCDISVTDSGGTNPVLVITPGAIWYVDEIYEVDAVSTNLSAGTTLANVLGTYYWDLSSTTTSPRVYYNGNTNDIKEIRKAIFTETPTTWVNIQNLKTIEYNIFGNVDKHLTDSLIEELGITSNATFEFTLGGVDYYKYNLQKGQHIIRLTVPVTVATHTVLHNIVPHADVYDGYTIHIVMYEAGAINSTLSLYNDSLLLYPGNLALSKKLSNYTVDLEYKDHSSVDQTETLAKVNYFTFFDVVSSSNITTDIYNGFSKTIKQNVIVTMIWDYAQNLWRETSMSILEEPFIGT